MRAAGRPRGESAPAHDIGLHQGPRAVADRGHGLPRVHAGLDDILEQFIKAARLVDHLHDDDLAQRVGRQPQRAAGARGDAGGAVLVLGQQWLDWIIEKCCEK